MTNVIESIVPIIMVVVFLFAVAVGIIMLVLIHQKKQVQYLRENEQMKIAFEKEILASKLEIQEQTLKNVSLEIHDNIGQVLSLVKFNMNTIIPELPADLQHKFLDSTTLVSKAIQDLRDLSRSLDTDFVLEHGLIRSVDDELELIKRTGTINTRLQLHKQPYRLDPQQELLLFRIVQEALHNILKHARAKHVAIEMTFNTDHFILRIEDDGIGMDQNIFETHEFKGAGLGIRNMYNRSRLMHAAMDIAPAQNRGTVITITLPIPPEKN